MKFEVSYKSIFIVLGIALGILALIKLWSILILIIVSLIFMAALLPAVDWLARHRIPRGAGVLLILVVVLASIAGIFAIVIPASISEFKSLRDHLPDKALEMQNFLENFGIKVDLQTEARNIDWNKIVSGDDAISLGQQIFSWFLTFLAITTLTAYMLADAPRISLFIYKTVPEAQREHVKKLLGALRLVVGGYMRVRVITSVAIGLFTLTVLLILGVPNAGAYAILAGFFDIIPLVGAFGAVGLPVIAAYDESALTGIIALSLLLTYQQFEDRILVPRIYGRALNLHPVVVLIAILIGGKLMGIVGVLLALPFAASLRAFFDFANGVRGSSPAKPPDDIASRPEV